MQYRIPLILSTWLFTSAAMAQSAVPVWLGNNTSIPVELRVTQWTDANGDQHTDDITWKIDGGASTAQLTLDGRPFVADDVHCTLKTVDGEKSWVYSRRGDNNFLNIQIAANDLAAGDGPVNVVNQTTGNVHLILLSYVDIDGNEHSLSRADLDFQPQESSGITLSGAPLRASRLEYLIQNDAGASAWHTDYAGGGKLEIDLTPELIQRHVDAVHSAKASAIVKLVGAFIADYASKQSLQQSDNDLGPLIVGGLERALRNSLIDSAVEDAFPAVTPDYQEAISRGVGLVFDGQLNPKDFAEGEVRDRLIARLEIENPDAGHVAEIASFLSDLSQERDRELAARSQN